MKTIASMSDLAEARVGDVFSLGPIELVCRDTNGMPTRWMARLAAEHGHWEPGVTASAALGKLLIVHFAAVTEELHWWEETASDAGSDYELQRHVEQR